MSSRRQIKISKTNGGIKWRAFRTCVEIEDIDFLVNYYLVFTYSLIPHYIPDFRKPYFTQQFCKKEKKISDSF